MVNLIHEFFEIFNARFWLLLAELLYFPAGFAIGCVILMIKEKRGDQNETN